ncbi:MAG: Alkaline phosphatase 3 [Stenotrophomonas maltophilia]|uniref:Alkaline phosphatase 3 n=1 Tax=Stenotrophomonas maltophilia TaxID=40324 RepID=A0A7V8FGR1_STEMA|nr:MAG: Alkaline phosphatase 3 [Stenotrophomonas maltophilia]
MSRFLSSCSARHRAHLSVLLAAGLLASAPLQAKAPRAPEAPTNIIVMINEGAGWGTWDATAYWQYGSREGTPYAAFPQRYGMTTFPLNTSNQPTGDSAQKLGYDAARARDATPVQALDLSFAGFQYLAAVATDSAAAGTALSSGSKTYNNAINVDNHGQPLDYSTLHARRLGMATGVVTTVPFAHATPAAFAAQNVSRNDYHGIAHQMLSQGHLDLVMGTGAPDYTVDGQPCSAALTGTVREGCDTPWEFVAEQDWQQLQAGQVIGGNPAGAWTLLRSREDFARLADGRLATRGPVIGVPQVARTLQPARQQAELGSDDAQPSRVRRIDSVPDLALMTRGALTHLARQSDKGLFLMVEGGATDWAAHTSA